MPEWGIVLMGIGFGWVLSQLTELIKHRRQLQTEQKRTLRRLYAEFFHAVYADDGDAAQRAAMEISLADDDPIESSIPLEILNSSVDEEHLTEGMNRLLNSLRATERLR